MTTDKLVDGRRGPVTPDWACVKGKERKKEGSGSCIGIVLASVCIFSI